MTTYWNRRLPFKKIKQCFCQNWLGTLNKRSLEKFNWIYPGNTTITKDSLPEIPKEGEVNSKHWQNKESHLKPRRTNKADFKRGTPFESHMVYNEPSLQRQHLFPKTLPLKWISCCKKSLMSRLICKKGLVLFLFPHRIHAEAILTNTQNICFFKALNTIFLHNL